MKSFFKKLAFVMAMAMVVSLAAPAAAKADVLPLYLAYQNETEKVEGPVVLAPEATVDFCFQGAQAGWRELERGWESSNEAVATVDNNGLVTAVAAGTATITFKLAGYEDASVQVVVAAPQAADTMEVVQKSGSALAINFAGETLYDVKDVVLYIVYENESDPENPIKIKWPIDASKSKKEGNTITITPFVELGDGDNYEVVVGDKTAKVTTKIGTVDEIQITAAKNQVYKDTDVKVTAKLLSGGIDITDRVLKNYEIKYDQQILAGSDDDFLKTVDVKTGTATYKFFKEGVSVAVQATVIDSKDVVYATSDYAGIESVAKPAWAFDGKVVDWALIAATDTKVDWNKKFVPADKSATGQYSIVLKFADSEGKTYVTQANAVQEDDDTDPENIYMDGNDAISKAKLSVRYYSANEEVMLVAAKTGKIGVYTPETGVFYIGLVDFTGDTPVEKYIYAGEIEIKEPTKLDAVSVEKNTATVTATTVTGTDFVKKATTKLFPIDQYEDAWAAVEYEVYYYAKDNAKKTITGATSWDDENKCWVIELEGSDLQYANDSIERVFINAKSTDTLRPATVSTYIDVTIVAPKTDNGKIVYDLEIRNDYYKKYPVVEIEDVEFDLKDSVDGYLSKELVLYKTSNGAQVGVYTSAGDEDFAGFELPKTEEAIKALTKEGTRYVVMRDPSGKIVELSNGFGFKLNKVENGVVTFAETGVYTVQIVTIRYNSGNGNRNDYVVNGHVSIKNTTASAEYVGQASKTFSDDYIDSLGNVDVKAVVRDVMKFKIGDADWKPAIADILKVNAVVIDDSVIIQYVQVKVPVGDAYVIKDILPSSVICVTAAPAATN